MSKYFIFYSENELSLDNVKDECVVNKWASVACYYNNEKSHIIAFNQPSIAMDFIRRNFSKKEMIGIMVIPDEHVIKIKEKHSLECFSFPRKISSIKIEIIELDTELEVQVNSQKVI